MARPQRLTPFTLVIIALGVVLLGFLQGGSPQGQTGLPLRLDPTLLVVRELRLGPLVLATYRARVLHDGPTAIRGVTATLLKPPRTILVLDSRLTFGDVPAGGTVTSQDTFTVLRHRHDPFTTTALAWAFDGTPVPVNTPPVARAGPDQTVPVGQTVTLDGSPSTDVDGNSLTYQWTFVSVPVGSLAALDDPTLVRPTFTVDRPGSSNVQLIVHDGTAASAPVFVTITTQNSHPVAQAGADQTVAVGETVQLHGTKSSDVDGDALSWHWTMRTRPPGSTAPLSDPLGVTPTFVVDQAGAYVVQLIVSDGTLESPPDTVTITTQNSSPVAQAGPDQTVFVGDTVQLNGSQSSDIDGDPLRWHWAMLSRPPGSTAQLSNPVAVPPTFVVDRAGAYVVQLIVSDGTLESTPDTATITTQNSSPVAQAGPEQTVFVGDTVQLDGSASTDTDGNSLRYSWALVTTPPGSLALLADPQTAHPSFLVDLPGTYGAQLIVHDGQGGSTPDTVTISTQNSRPVARAGPDQSVFLTDTVHLDGRASSDADGDPLSYRWALIAVPMGSNATLSHPFMVQPTFVVDRPGTYVAQLFVHDGTVESGPDTVMLTTANRPPVLAPMAAQTVVRGTTLPLQLNATDPDGDALTFLVDALPANASLDAATGHFTFTPVDTQVGTFSLTFTVSDGQLTDTQTTSITVQLPPFACPPLTIATITPQTGAVGTEVTITCTFPN